MWRRVPVFVLLSLGALALPAAAAYVVLMPLRVRHWFAWPPGLVLAALVPTFLALALCGAGRRRAALARLGTAAALGGRRTAQGGPRLLRGCCVLLGLLLLGFGAAGPQWGRDRQQSAVPGRDVVAVLDCSRSMLAENPSRFERARAALADLSREVQKRGGHRLGLVVFAGRAELACPLTHDYDHFRATLDDLDPEAFAADLGPGEHGVSGTRIGLALRTAVEAYDGNSRGARDILLLSDGDDPAADGEWNEGAAAALAAQIPVHAVGVGDPDQASTIPAGKGVLTYDGLEVRTKLEEEPLKEIARRTQGTYVAAHTHALPLGTVYLNAVATRPVREASVDPLPLYRQRYRWFLLPALVLFAAAVALPDRLPRLRPAPAAGFALAFLLAAAPAPDPDALLKEGNAAFARGDFARAVELYEKAEPRAADPGHVAFNLAQAKYRLAVRDGSADAMGDAEQLYRCCLGANDPRRAAALFGLGNCLLRRAGEKDGVALRSAAEAFEQCAQAAGEDAELAADARYNLERARLLLAQSRPAAGDPKPPDEEPGGAHETNPKPPPPKPDPERNPQTRPADGGEKRPRPTPGGDAAKAEPGTNPVETDRRPAPGAGDLRPVPDDAAAPPLPAREAREHLEQAAERIWRERRRHRLQGVKPPAADVRDW